MDNIILIGMPGCGKSTIGVILAKKLMYSFLDSDLVIQQRAGKRLYRILEEDGAEAFAKLENEVNASLDVTRTVVATGGSAVYWEESMNHLKSIGTVVYIMTDYEELKRRIGDFATRGIYLPEGMSFEELYRERTPLYERYADITVQSGNGPTWETVERIATAIDYYREEEKKD